MANTLKHKTIPAGSDRPGFTGVTPSLYAEEHAFAGGGQGSVLIRNTGATDGASWVQSLVGVLMSAGTDNVPSFGTTLPATVQGNITTTGTVTAGTWSASFGAVSGANLTSLTAANITGVHTLPDGVLSTNVPLLNATNVFTANQTLASKSSTKTAVIGSNAIDNATAVLQLLGSNTQKNWQIATNSSGGLELTPSTAGGGSTFTTAVFSLTNAGVLSIPATGAHTIGAGGAGSQSTLTINGSSASGGGPYVAYAVAGTPKVYVGTEAGIVGGTNSNGTFYTVAGNSLKFYPNATYSWGMNSAGDLTVGASSHIIDSVGTPSIGASTGGTSPTISGSDYGFVITWNANTSVTVNFGHAFSTAPCVVASTSVAGANGIVTVTSVSTSSVQLNNAAGSTMTVYVMARGT